MRHIFTLLLFALLFTHVLGQGKAKRHPPTHTDKLKYVQDNANWLTPVEEDSLRSQFARYEKENGVWFSVWTEPILTGSDVNRTNYRHYNARKVLRKDSTRGVVLSFFSKDRKMAIAVGINLEDKLTKTQRKHIMDEVMRPLLKSGNNYEAITAGIAEAQRILAGMPTVETDNDYNWLSQLWRNDVSRVILVFAFIISGTVSGMIITKYRIGNNNNHLQNIPLIVLVFLPVLGAVILYFMGSMGKRRRGSSGSGSYSSSDDDSDDSSSSSSSSSDYSSSGSDYSSSDSSGSSSSW